MYTLLLQEYIKIGQRFKAFSVEAEVDGKWKKIDSQTTIGYKRILQFESVNLSKLKINITDAKGSPTISNIELYNAPKVLIAPKFFRNKNGVMRIEVPDKEIEVYYTLDGSNPNISSKKYTVPFLLEEPTTLKAIAYDPVVKKLSEVSSKYFDISKRDWKVIFVTSGRKDNLKNTALTRMMM